MPAGIRLRARLNRNRRIRPQTKSGSFRSALAACRSGGRGASRRNRMRRRPAQNVSTSWQSNRRLRLSARQRQRVPCRGTW
eukprot:2013278-Alexandrium_andersonii.AAC.1